MKCLKKIGKIVLGVVGTLSIASCSSGKWNKNAQIDVLSREEGSGTRGAFIELFGIEKKDASGTKVDYTTEEAAITNSTAVMLSSVAGDKYSIGYVSLGSLNDSVKALKINDVFPSVENINNGTYKISRPFNIAVKENLSAPAQDFVNFIFSESGQKIIVANKYINVPAKAYSPASVSGKVVVAGSSSVSPVMEKLIEGYKSVNPNVNVELQTSDSTTGVSSAIEGICDIGMASRELKSSELAKGVKGLVIAVDGIAVVANKENPIESLDKDSVQKIFTGEIETWSQVR